MKKILLVLSIALISSLVVYAEGTKEKDSEEPITISVWMGSWWADQIPIIEEAFAEAYDDMRVEIEPVPISGYVDKAVASTLGGNPPDVLALDATFIPAMVNSNLLENWDGYKSRLDIEDFAGAIWSAGIFDGSIFAVPYRASSTVFYYNKNMFDNAGIPYPSADWTYPEMLEIMKGLTVAGEQWGYGMAGAISDPSNVMGQLASLVWAFGGEVLSADGKTILLTDKAAIDAMKFWAELYTTHKVAPPGSINYSSNDQLDLFLANKVATFNHADSASKALANQTDIEWGIQVFPERVNRGGGWSYTIPVGAENPDAGREYVIWFTKSENLAKYTIRMPSRPSATTSDPWNNDIYKVFLDSAKSTRLLPVIPQWTDIQNIWIREMQNVLEGSMTVEEAMAIVKKEGEALIR